MSWITISELDDPQLDVYRNLKQSNLTRWSGLVIAEGQKVVERLMTSEWTIKSLLISEQKVHHFEREPDCPAYVVSEKLAQRLIGYHFHAGYLACGERPANPPLQSLVLSHPQSLLVACPRITDPENLGTIIRTASAFGADGLLLGEESCNPFSRRTLRVSMGTAFSLPIREATEITTDLNWLQRERGYQIIATALREDAIALSKLTPSTKQILLLGNEAHGLAGEHLELADVIATIPMARGTDSLNVGIAAGIFLHHLAQLRSMPNSAEDACFNL